MPGDFCQQTETVLTVKAQSAFGDQSDIVRKWHRGGFGVHAKGGCKCQLGLYSSGS